MGHEPLKSILIFKLNISADENIYEYMKSILIFKLNISADENFFNVGYKKSKVRF